VSEHSLYWQVVCIGWSEFPTFFDIYHKESVMLYGENASIRPTLSYPAQQAFLVKPFN
jgi:hypothetical protein